MNGSIVGLIDVGFKRIFFKVIIRGADVTVADILPCKIECMGIVFDIVFRIDDYFQTVLFLFNNFYKKYSNC